MSAENSRPSDSSMSTESASCNDQLNPTNNTDSFHRIPSESSITKSNLELLKTKKPWERSQSALDLEPMVQCQRSGSAEYGEATVGGKVSEQSRVYWDLSRMDDDGSQVTATTTSTSSSSSHSGKFKISLQTIHQKEEMKSASPSVSIQTRVVRRMSSETSMQIPHSVEYTEVSLPSSGSPPKLQLNDEQNGTQNTPSPGTSHTKFMFTLNQSGRPNLTVVLANTVPILQDNIKQLRAPSISEQVSALKNMLTLIEQAWAMPAIGRDVAYGLCDVLRTDGGLEILIQNCATDTTREVKLGSARVLEQTMTVGNREYVAQRGLEVIVKLASNSRDDVEMAKATTGILECLFKHSEHTCHRVIRFGGLDTILYSCRQADNVTLKHCAIALANLAIFGGEENQHEMIMHNAPEWLFPLAFSSDDSTRYYAILAISVLSANKELEPAVSKSGTMELVEPFIRDHDPLEFAKSDKAHVHGQSKDWLQRLVPLLSSRKPEAQSLAAFHFAMEAGIKAQQGKLELFREIEAIEPLKRLASSTNKLASKYARQALQIIGEEIPYKLSSQVPLWTKEDVVHWLQQVGFTDYINAFDECQVDGDLLLTLSEDNLINDIHMTNGIIRKRFIRELNMLQKTADYQSCDPSNLDSWLRELEVDFCRYSYQMLKSGVDRRTLRWLTDDHLLHDCHIQNGIHRMKIMEGSKRLVSMIGASLSGQDYGGLGYDKTLDVFISYRRSNGAQLASLLKVHLQLRGFTVFLDIEKLRAGKFDDNLLNSVRNARNFILVLTPGSLERCMGDSDQKDWVHREIVAALEGGCNIIPVMDNFQWPPPENLPEDMRPVCYFNGIRWIHDYQDACVDKLEKFITGELSTRQQSSIQRPSLSKGSSLSSMPEIHNSPCKRGMSNGANLVCPSSAPVTSSFDQASSMTDMPNTHG